MAEFSPQQFGLGASMGIQPTISPSSIQRYAQPVDVAVMPNAGYFQSGSLSPEVLQRYYEQQIQPANIPVERFAEPQMQQTAPVQQQSQQINPDQGRLQYAQLIEQRFNELANKVGGVENVVKYKLLDQFRSKAAQDVDLIYGKPEIVQPMRVESVEGVNFAIGPRGQPMKLPTPLEQQAEELALRKAQAELTQTEQKASTEASKTKQESSSAATGLGLSVKIFDNALSLAKEMRESPALLQTVGGGNPLAVAKKAFDRNIQGTPQYNFSANAKRLKSTAFAQAVTMLKGMGALSNAEGAAITNALTDVDNLGQSPEQYQKRLDEFISLMDSLIASKKKELSSYQTPQIDLQNFDIRSVPISNQQEQTQNLPPSAGIPNDGRPIIPVEPPTAGQAVKPVTIPSPGGLQFVRDPQTGKLIIQR
jgi:hypothetical protein